MRGHRLALVVVLVLTVSLAGCPDGGEDGSGYARTDANGDLLEDVPEGPRAQVDRSSGPNTSAFVPGSTNT